MANTNRPASLWELIVSGSGIIIFLLTTYISMEKAEAQLTTRITHVEVRLDKYETKLDKILESQEEIKIMLERKQDRNK